MLPAHVRGPESAVFWILAWFDRLGGIYVPDDPVQVFQDIAGTLIRVRVEAVVNFAEGPRLEVAVELDGELRCRRAFFDRFDSAGERTWGWHHHPERRGANHRHDPPGVSGRTRYPADLRKDRGHPPRLRTGSIRAWSGWPAPRRGLTTIAVRAGDIPTGTLHKIERDLEPGLGKGWLRR